MKSSKDSFFSFLQLRDNRDYGIELLRIVAMYMILILHVLGAGGILHLDSITGTKYWVAWFLEIAAYSAVDIYALISDFVGYKAKHRYSSIVELWLRVIVYSVSFTIINKMLFDPSMGKRKILLSFFPVTQTAVWYFTMYFCLFFFFPVLNAAIESLSRKTLRNTLVSIAILFSVLPLLWASDTFKAEDGYSVIWLIVLYLIGAYIGKYNAFSKVKKRTAFLIFICVTVMTWGMKYIIENHFTSFFGRENNPDFLVNYTSVTVLVAGICMLILFRNMDLPRIIKRITAIIAPLTFSVYIIHVLPLIQINFIKDKFIHYNTYSAPIMILAMLGTAAVIFIACAALDFIRARVFDLLRIKERLNALENRIISKIT